MATTDATPLVAANARGLLQQTVVPVLDTVAYAALDALHTLDLKFPGMARAVGGGGRITKLVVIDKDDQAAAGVLWLFTAALANTTHTANGALAIHDTDLATCIGTITFGAYSDGGNGQVSVNGSVDLFYQCDPADDALYGVLQTLGAPTHTASGLTILLQAVLL